MDLHVPGILLRQALGILIVSCLVAHIDHAGPSLPGIGPCLSQQGESVDNTWIIRFTAYLPYAETRAYVDRLVSLSGCGCLRFVERDNLVSRGNMMTDFAVVAARGLGAEEVAACVKGGLGTEEALVKDVWPDSEIRGREVLGVGGVVDGGSGSDDEMELYVVGKRRSGRLQTRWPNEIDVGGGEDGEVAVEDGDRVHYNNGQHSNNNNKRRLTKQADETYRLLVERLDPQQIWREGYRGQGIRMGVFDTGIKEDHPDVHYIEERSNWTHENTLADGLGHGSFVAGVIAGHHPDCPGLAPNVSIHTFKVFTNDQVSFTSWFLDAFNYAMATKIDIVNLSIGGPDYLDVPFVEKVMEATSSGMVMTSAIGNDGPTYGTMNNPADQNDVIGVGGITYGDMMAGFSSRGMTTWELPTGYGRAKPDVVTYGSSVRGAAIPGGCKVLSGTSVSSPVAAGALCLLASTIPEEKKRDVLNPAAMKQVLIQGAKKIVGANMFEQGQGALNIGGSYEVLKEYEPRASLVPAVLDLTACPYAWPFCTQPLYAHAMPTMFNATVLNGMGVDGRITRVSWTPLEGNAAAQMLDVRFEHSEQLWPWSGYVALFLRVRPVAAGYRGVAEGTVTVDVESPPGLGEPADAPRRSTATMRIKLEIIPTPPREKRILWDQFHSVKYPPAYLPRDDLQNNMDILDWHGDHLHTNFHTLYDTLRHEGYFMEVLASPFTCFDAEQYGTLMIVDSEEEFYDEEISKLAADVREKGLGLAVFADWYHEETISKMRFYDDNTRSWWDAVTGGAHVPGLNDLLRPLDAAFAGGAHKMTVNAPDGSNFDMASGSALAAMPAGSYVLFAEDGTSKTTNSAGKRVPRDVPVVGLATVGRGKIALYGDSNCLDSAYRRTSCESFAISVVRYLAEGDDAMLQGMERQEEGFGSFDDLPKRVAGVDYAKVSRVLQTPLACYSNSNAGTTFEAFVDDVGGDHNEVDDEPNENVDDEPNEKDGIDIVLKPPDIEYGADKGVASEEYQPPPQPPSLSHQDHVDPEVVFNQKLVTGEGKNQANFVTKELALASGAFLLLLLLGCARWNRRLRRRRPLSAERLPILKETKEVL